MKIDPYKNTQNYLSWKDKNKGFIHGITNENSSLILQYLGDMEKGINIANVSVKGARSHCRLRSIKSRLIFFSKKFKELYNLDNIVQINEDQLMGFFSEMRSGIIKRINGQNFTSPADYVKDMKAFWHWYQKTSKKKGIIISDITVDLDTSKDKPKWVYLTEEQIRQLSDNAKFEYRVIIMFLFDTGARAPSELMNIKVSDLSNDFKELNIRDEVSKTFGRRIKLMLCSELIKEYIKSLNLSANDYLFDKNPSKVNEYLQRLSTKILGDGESLAGQRYSQLTMYDFRHNACCYWLPKYKSESALKYRFGWKKSEKIHYYSELLGMKDTIQEEDMLIDVMRTEIEKDLVATKKQNQILEDRQRTTDIQLSQIMELVR